MRVYRDTLRRKNNILRIYQQALGCFAVVSTVVNKNTNQTAAQLEFPATNLQPLANNHFCSHVK